MNRIKISKENALSFNKKIKTLLKKIKEIIIVNKFINFLSRKILSSIF